MRLTALTCLSLLLLGTGCTRTASPDVYNRASTVSKVVRGTVVSTRPVTIQDDGKEGELSGGMIGGGLAGGIAGSTLGKGDGKTLAALGGALAGAAIGSLIETQLSTEEAVEYIIQLDPAPVAQQPATLTKKTTKRELHGSKVADDVNNALAVPETASEMLAVVQADEIPLPVGQRVLLIYNDDLPRVIADRSATLGPAFINAPTEAVSTPVIPPATDTALTPAETPVVPLAEEMPIQVIR